MIGQGGSRSVCSHSVTSCFKVFCIRFRSATFFSICANRSVALLRIELRGGAVFQAQQLADLVEREAEFLGVLDEVHVRRQCQRVLAEHSFGSRHGQ